MILHQLDEQGRVIHLFHNESERPAGASGFVKIEAHADIASMKVGDVKVINGRKLMRVPDSHRTAEKYIHR